MSHLPPGVNSSQNRLLRMSAETGENRSEKKQLPLPAAEDTCRSAAPAMRSVSRTSQKNRKLMVRETLQPVLTGLSAYTRRRTIRTVGTVHPPGLRQHRSIPPHTVREHVSAETGYLPVPANDRRQFTQPAALRFSSFFTTPSPANHTKNLQKLSIRTPQPDPTPFYRIIPRFARALPCPPPRGKTHNTQKLSTSCDHSPTYNFQKDSREKNRRNTFAAQHCP